MSSSNSDDSFLANISSNKDPYDRSYVRQDRFKDQTGVERLSATGVYDALSMPYHAANVLNHLKKRPQMTYAELANNPRENRKVAHGVVQTYDSKRQNTKNKPLANPRDEFPHAGTESKDENGNILRGQHRKDDPTWHRRLGVSPSRRVIFAPQHKSMPIQ